jgi:hypothetical protein
MGEVFDLYSVLVELKLARPSTTENDNYFFKLMYLSLHRTHNSTFGSQTGEFRRVSKTTTYTIYLRKLPRGECGKMSRELKNNVTGNVSFTNHQTWK